MGAIRSLVWKILLQKACIYDNYCNPLCNEMQQVAGYTLQYDNSHYPPAPLHHFDTINSGNLGGIITIDWYGWNWDGSIRMPNFGFM
jgi:hypothetical protein